MGDSKNNVNAMVANIKPSPPMFNMRPALSMRMVFRPGVALVFKKEGVRQAPDGTWEIKADPVEGVSEEVWEKLDCQEVWIVEDKGPPPEEYWSWGVFCSVQMADSVVGPRGEQKIVTADTGNMICQFPIALGKELERQMKFGVGGMVLRQ